jgi:hypothetical protein
MTTLLRLKKLTPFLTVFLLIAFAGTPAKAQFNDTGDLIRAGASDANILLQEYLRPFGNGFGADLNSGWVNTARPYGKLGFDLRVNLGVAVVPVGDRSFNVDEFEFENIERIGGPSESQTAFGDDVSGSTMGVYGTNPLTGMREKITEFTMPEGIGYPFVPAPMAQLTVGAIRDTDVSLRYMPSVEMDEFSAGLFGLGVRHGLNQWLPGGFLLPVDISVQAGYTRMTSDFQLNLRPEEGSDIYNPYQGEPEIWRGQHIDFVAEGFTGNLLIGKTLPILSFYAGVGFQSSSVSINSPGSYPITSFNPDYNPTDGSEETREKIIERLDDPVNINYTAENSVHALAGFRIRLAVLTISGSYTVADYPVANVGVGLSFR